eukprot:c4197_g1_i1.p1 GENE.c4197_g1_i1~~c4197_g1_i1.p1  ORF type:complete len:145 (-),score=33.53 c4197_g1_i1:118-498(-)
MDKNKQVLFPRKQIHRITTQVTSSRCTITNEGAQLVNEIASQILAKILDQTIENFMSPSKAISQSYVLKSISTLPNLTFLDELLISKRDEWVEKETTTLAEVREIWSYPNTRETFSQHFIEKSDEN